MGLSTHSIEINAPLRVVYDQWTQFAEFPHFMEGVEEVRQEGEKRLFWKAKIGGKVKEWEAEITTQVPDERIAWQSLEGSPNSGTITFEELGAGLTRVNAAIEYEPEGFLEKTGDALGIPSGRIEGDLKRFRDYVEERGRETGGWSGQVGVKEHSDLGDLTTTGSRRGGAADAGYPREQELSQRVGKSQLKQAEGESTIEDPLSEEEVKVGKKSVDAGEKTPRKKITTARFDLEDASGATERRISEMAPPEDIGLPPMRKAKESSPRFVTKEQIELRAYFIAERRKALGLGGDEIDDWAQAERELREE
jgi:hypothetical protein